METFSGECEAGSCSLWPWQGCRVQAAGTSSSQLVQEDKAGATSMSVTSSCDTGGCKKQFSLTVPQENFTSSVGDTDWPGSEQFDSAT